MTTNGRDTRGRFAKGNPAIGAGRPKNFGTRLQTLSDSVSEEDWIAICQRAVKEAIAGDAKARMWLSSYLIGVPNKILELAAADQELLRELLTVLNGRGVAASDLFNSMLAELAAGAVQSDDEDDHD